MKTAILTLSDKGSRGERVDESGKLIIDSLEQKDYTITFYKVIPDERDILKKLLVELSEKADLIITNGGTGLSPRDITPDVTLEVIDRQIPGIAEAMRLKGLEKTPRAMLTRGVSGIRGNCLIVNLPGSPKAVMESLEVIIDVLPHAIEKIKGSEEDCART
ncbi:MAG: MogA/MoaB family molybdenum cofactor biosynthesis protein [Nitrospirae bacterium]|nr:MAG: MogA/MoaB family molybdenum cofactor biosynthesis protein [Nitrospirota bacterium]